MRIAESPFKQIPVFLWKCCLHVSSPNLIENDHNFVFFDYKVWTQQHFESRLFWKNAEKLRICALFIFSDKRETDKLWKVSLNRKPFQCLTRKDVQDKLKKEKEDLVAMKRKCRLTNKQNNEMTVKVRTQEKQIQAQRFVMNNLRNGIDYLKEHCKRDTADSKLFFMQ